MSQQAQHPRQMPGLICQVVCGNLFLRQLYNLKDAAEDMHFSCMLVQGSWRESTDERHATHLLATRRELVGTETVNSPRLLTVAAQS